MSDTFCGYDGQRDEMIVAYVYGELTVPERTAFMRHLNRCAACRHEIDALGDVRAELAAWSPPEIGRVVNRRLPAERRLRTVGSAAAPAPPDARETAARRPWRDIPAWAQYAAAILLIGVAAGIANLDITYNGDGLSVHTGWLNRPVARADSASTAEPVATQADLAALEQQLRAELQSSVTPAVATAPAGMSEQELVRRVRLLIRDSEQRQQRELALRVAEVAQDAQAQRQADLVKIDRTLGALQNTTGTAVRRQEQLLNSLAVRVSQKQ
jgi:anti-sigma factor RsiW